MSTFTIRMLTEADIPAGMRLKRAAGWNQTEADWRRTIDLQPDGCYAGLCDGSVVATLTHCVFGRVAWIAMVLTDPAFRGRGFASRLLERALADLRERGIESIRLDATELGRPVYEKFGFAVDFELQRWDGIATAGERAEIPNDAKLRDARADDLPAIVELDRRASGCDRGKFLARLQADESFPGVIAECSGLPVGFVLQRQGELAVQIGPLGATNEATAEHLLRNSLDRTCGRRTYVDLKSGDVALSLVLQSAGLGVKRTFQRMTLGTKITEFDTSTWISSGPEKG